MKLIVIGSSSKGNCYLLKSETETLILEAGVKLMEVKKALDFDLSSITGCLITHEHLDHAKYVKEYLQAGINVHTSQGTKNKIQPTNTRLISVMHESKLYQVGQFKIMPIEVIHDAEQPFGYVIHHPECGTTLFVTDTHYLPVKVRGMNNILCEVNYDIEIANKRISEGSNVSVRNRVIETHMELSTFIELLKENDTSALHNVVMLHLSDSNSNSRYFKRKIQEVVPGKTVNVAETGMIINLNITPF